MTDHRPSLLPLLLAAALPAQTEKAQPLQVDRTLAVINDRVITLRDVNRELGLRPLTDPELRGNPRRIAAERQLILRRLTVRRLLEQAIYSLQYDAARIEQVVAMQVQL